MCEVPAKIKLRWADTVVLGGNRVELANGFVLFKNASLARTGEQIYHPSELADEIGVHDSDGMVHVTRPASEVFRPESMDSLNGMPLVNDHPPDDVGPHNFRELIHGVVLNPRRGKGDQSEELVGDVLVMSRELLADIDAGKREVSAGYNADYYKTGDGQAEQRNILFNHLAQVQAGRCGHRCALRDEQHKGVAPMAKLKKFFDSLANVRDLDGLKKAVKDAEDDGTETHIHIHMPEVDDKEEDDEAAARITALENTVNEMKIAADVKDAAIAKMILDAKAKAKDEDEDDDEDDDVTEDELAEEAPDGTEQAARKAKDSVYLEESYNNVKRFAEIIAPGVKIPSFDRTASPKKTFRDCVCALRREALQAAAKDADTAALITSVRGKSTKPEAFKSMDSEPLRAIFNGVAAAKAAMNNGRVTRFGAPIHDGKTATADDRLQQQIKAAHTHWNLK